MRATRATHLILPDMIGNFDNIEQRVGINYVLHSPVTVSEVQILAILHAPHKSNFQFLLFRLHSLYSSR